MLDGEQNTAQIRTGWLVVLGVGWGLVVGVLVALISRNRGLLGAASAPINIYNNVGGGAQMPQLMGPVVPSINPAAQQAAPSPPAVTAPTKLATYTISTTDASWIMRAASANYWRVTLRVLSPPGAVVRIATDPNGLMFPSMSTALQPGPPTDIRVRPGDALYAISDTANTQLSVTATEEPT